MKFYCQGTAKAKFYRKPTGGSEMAEMGPAVLVIFVIILVPMLDILYLGLAYASGWYANHLSVREVAVRKPVQYQAAGDSALGAWQASGLAAFIHASNVVNTVTFEDAGANPVPATSTAIAYCLVKTSMQIQPFLPIPFLTQVAGINAPVSFAFSAQRPQEEKGLN